MLRCLFTLLVSLPCLCSSQVAPTWVQVLPQRAGRIYALGTATVAADEAKALELAAQDARFEVIARLRVAVQGSTTVSTTLTEHRASGSTTSGTRDQRVRQDGTTSVQAVNLPGLIIEERYVDRQTGSAYALAYLDVGIAERSLLDQVEALVADWIAAKSDSRRSGLRPSMTWLQRIKGLQNRASALEPQAALLIPAGVPATVRAGVQALGQEIGRETMTQQAFLTIGAKVQGGDLDQDVLALLRNAAISQGFIWTQNDPVINLVIELRGGKQNLNIPSKSWWDLDTTVPNLVATRAAIRISLRDAGGDTQDSFDLFVKGVGVDLYSSEQALLKELRRTLPLRFEAFLSDLLRPVTTPVPSNQMVSSVGVSILSIELSSDDKDAATAAKKAIQEQLRDVLHASGRYHWVERADSRLQERIMKELALQNSGLVASEETRNFGRLAGIGVFAVVSGDLSIGMFGCTLALKVRMVEVETTKLLQIYEFKTKGPFRMDPNKSAEEAVTEAMKALLVEFKCTPPHKEKA